MSAIAAAVGGLAGSALIGGTAAVVGGAALGGAIGLSQQKSADKAAGAATDAANVQAGAQLEALNYLKETEALPQQLREGALTQLGGMYGLEGGEGSQQDLIDQARQSPLYAAMMGTQQFGEESILRNASATGGLRSGNVQEAMYDYNTQLQNQALLESYNQQLQGLQGLGQLPSNANNIANGYSQIGATQAQGITAAAQAQQQGSANILNSAMGLGNLGISAYGAGLFSDKRLKTNIKLLGKIKEFNWYSWDWNKKAEALGLTGKSEGVIADEIYLSHPEAVTVDQGFMKVNYNLLALQA